MVKMLVTRPEPGASDTAARLAALDIEPVIAPVLVHETLTPSLPEPKGFAAMAVTSANALRALQERGALTKYLGLKLFAVGERTASAARTLGFADIVTANGGGLAGLAEKLVHARLAGPVFYPSAREPSGDLAKSLAPHGLMVITAQTYAMVPVKQLPETVLAGLEHGTIAAALFYSRRTTQAFVSLTQSRLNPSIRRKIGMLCLAEAIAEPLIGAHFVRIGLADYPSEDAMMGLALSFARDQNAS